MQAVVLCVCRSEASKYLVEVLESVDRSELDDVIEKVLDAVEKQPCKFMLCSLIGLLVCLAESFQVVDMVRFHCSVFLYDRAVCGGERCAGLHSVL